jgi:putative N-acetylmannosamine-6-phosphate epimerase
LSAAQLPLRRGLIVSCQAYAGEPLFGPAHMVAMARAVIQGGAVGLRANSPEDIAAIRAVTDLPIIGLYKRHTPGSEVYITPDLAAAAAIAAAGCDMVAVDATPRPRAGGVTLAELIRYVHDTLGKPVMADVSCLEDARLAEALGADVLGTTLAGYTAHGRPRLDGPDLEFLGALVQAARVPVIAEGRYWQPAEVAQAFALGAFAAVVGSAITRPWEITRRFAQAVPTELRPAAG